MLKSKYTALFLILLSADNNRLAAQSNLIQKNKALFAAGESNWFQRNLPAAKAFFGEYLSLEKIPNDTNDVVNANDLMANVYLTLGMYDSALYYSSAGFDAISKIKSQRFIGNLNQTKGRIHLQLGDIPTAIRCMIAADSFYMASSEKILKDIAPYTALALAAIYRELKQFDKAKEYYELALARTKNVNNDQVTINIMESLAGFYIANNEYAKANAIYQEIVGKNKGTGIMPQRLYTYLGMGDVYQGYKKFDSAMYYYKLCLAICVQQDELYQLDAIYVKMAAAFFQSRKFGQAALYADSSLQLVSRTRNIHLAIQACNILTEVALIQKHFDRAVFYLQKKEKYTDSLLNGRNLEISNNLYILNKVRQKDEAISILNKSDQVNKDLIKKREIISYLLMGIVCLSVLFFVIYQNRMKLKKQLEQQTAIAEERERIITDLHDDLGASLSSMHIYGDLAENVWYSQPEASKEMVAKITQQAKDLMVRMGDIIWSMKPTAEEKYSLTVRLANFSNELLAPRNIACHLEIDETLVHDMHAPEVRKNILLIVKEAMNNIAKHSLATDALVSLKQQENDVILMVSDNGQGYDESKVSAGNGVRNIMQRCKQFNGRVEIVSSPGKGVCIKCIFPLNMI